MEKGGLTKSATIVDDFLEVKYNSDLAQFYIINYRDTGFIIISGDNRLNPVLAYSDSRNFPICDSIMPSGLLGWLSSTCNMVDSIRKSNREQDVVAKYNWERALSGASSMFRIDERNSFTTKSASTTQTTDLSSIVWVFGENSDIMDCSMEGQKISEYYIYVPELLSTNWHQGMGYNELLDFGSCLFTGNGNYAVGCVAIAVGQVMMYNRYPSSFNWNAIYNSGQPYGNATNVFLKGLGDPGNLNMEYGCESTSDNNRTLIYLHNQGYSSAYKMSTVDPVKITNNLRYGHPVLFSGGHQSGWWVFAQFVEGHMWVCDGIKSYYYDKCFVAGGSYDTKTEIDHDFQYYHMNWGWGGTANGWYSYGGFTPKEDDGTPHDLNYLNRVIVDIKP